MTNGDGITYTTKELILKLEAKIDLIDAKLDRKVDRDDFARITERVEKAADRAAVLALEMRFSNLERQIETQDKINAALQRQAKQVADSSEAAFTRREKIFGVIAAIIALSIQVWVVTGGGL